MPIYICEVCSDRLVDCHLFRLKLLNSKTNLEQDLLADIESKEETVFAIATEIQEENDMNDFSLGVENTCEKDNEFDDSCDYNDSGGNDDDDDEDNNSKVDTYQPSVDNKQYDCDFCGDLFDDREMYVTHLSTSHSEAYKSKIYINERLAAELTCQWCLQQYTNSSNYHRHIRMVHDFKGKFRIKKGGSTKPNIVEISEKRNLLLLKHDRFLGSAADSKLDEELAKELICQWCHQQFTHSSNYHRHLKRMHGFTEKFNIKGRNTMKPNLNPDCSLECSHCGTICESSYALIKHLKSKHGLSKSLAKGSHTSNITDSNVLNEDGDSIDNDNGKNEDSNGENSETTDTNPKKYKCSACFQEFKFSSNCRRHLKNHHGLVGNVKTQDFLYLLDEPTKKYVCDVCAQPFCKRILFIKHFHQNHMAMRMKDLDERCVKKRKCQWCWKQFTSSSNFYRHLRIVHGVVDCLKFRCKDKSDKNYICDKCDKNFINPETFINHFKQVHIKDDNDLFCQICAKYFATKISFQRHARIFHNTICTTSQNLEFNCVKCKCEFSNRQDFIRHLVREHAIPSDHPDNETSEQLVCPICAKPSTNKSNFRRHLRIVHNLDEEVHLIVKPANSEAKKYTCEKCNDKFSKHQEFLKHFYQKHLTISDDALNNLSEDEPTCPGCSITFSTSNRLYRHLKIYHGIKIKGKENNRVIERKRSDYKQKKEKGLVCDICAKVYSSMSNLRRHLYDAHYMLDDASDPKAADEEGDAESVSEKSDLKCTICDRKMSNTSNLYRHLRSIHGLNQAFLYLTDEQRAEMKEKGTSIEEIW